MEDRISSRLSYKKKRSTIVARTSKPRTINMVNKLEKKSPISKKHEIKEATNEFLNRKNFINVLKKNREETILQYQKNEGFQIQLVEPFS